jgi:hypothetical protein
VFKPFADAGPYLGLTVIPELLGWAWLLVVIVGLNVRPRWAPSLARVLTPLTAGLVLTFAPIVFGVVRARSELAATILTTETLHQHADMLAHDMSAQMQILFLAGSSISNFVLLLFIAVLPIVAVAGRRARRPLAPPMLLTIALALPLLVTGTALTLWGLQMIHAFAAIGQLAADDKMAALASGFAVAHHRIVLGRWILAAAVAVAGALATWAAVRAARAGFVVSRRALGAAAFTFLVGVVAVAGTRGHAADAAQLLPLSAPDQSVGMIAQSERAPRVERCQPVPGQAPILFVSGGQIQLNGKTVEPSGLGDLLDSLRQYFPLLHPGREWRGELYVLAAPNEPSAAIVASLAAVHRARGWDHVLPVLIRVEPTPTHTLGVLTHQTLCTRPITLADDGQSMRPFATWGDIISAAVTGQSLAP